MPPTTPTISALRTAALCTFAMSLGLGIGLLLLALEFTSDFPGHHSATRCVVASGVLGYFALVGLVVFIGVPEPGEPRVHLPRAHTVAR